MMSKDDRFSRVTFDLGYIVMPNGDIITSDGKPRDVDEIQLRTAQELAGHPLEFRFRSPRPDEIDSLREQCIIP